jgi:hypothetical protein
LDPVVSLAVEHEGAVRWAGRTLHRIAGLTILEITDDFDFVGLEVLAGQQGGSGEQQREKTSHVLRMLELGNRDIGIAAVNTFCSTATNQVLSLLPDRIS